MKISIRPLAIVASVVALSALTACVAPQPVYETARYPYQPPPPQMAPGAYVEYGRVANIEVIQSQSSGAPTTGAGAIAGGAVGGVLGNQIGHGGGRAAATALGLVGGALLGNSIEANNNAPRTYQTYRVSIQTDNGGYRAFDVPSPGDLRIGDRVVINNGQISRY
ncbi:glycine zipper 2TM domain-containing protein [Variovorax sp. YR216]|uniref:glycine zipper 2TM domain-containing protein n=1 Tax=Variovorax sp. YR216 TaxID=1882828 RepID=UPI000899F5DA|nr:glycine zipper 2TM domain-containing protein [Variovorax sp. YR216]SEB17595.1 Outer membrane lipoprotein SlyB [Variovorax sp. YR216]